MHAMCRSSATARRGRDPAPGESRNNRPEDEARFETIFERIRAHYDAGEALTAVELRPIIEAALRELSMSVDNPGRLMDIFTNKINNALFRHQALAWLAELSESDGVRIHLYGRGWEKHPTLAKFARGIADNETELSAIYQASKINLQVTPWGTAHQRVFDGTAAGGFFLFRGTPAERCDRIYRDLWQWCDANRIRSDHDLKRAAKHDAVVGVWIDEITRINTRSPFDHGYDFVTELAITAAAGFTRSAATLWDEYDDVVFDTRQQLHDRVRRFLRDDAARAQIRRDAIVHGRAHDVQGRGPPGIGLHYPRHRLRARRCGGMSDVVPTRPSHSSSSIARRLTARCVQAMRKYSHADC